MDTNAQQLLTRIEAALKDPQDAREFRDLLNSSMQLLGLSDVNTADLVSVTRPTVNRWRNGNACPHPVMRKPTYRVLRRELRRQIARRETRPI